MASIAKAAQSRWVKLDWEHKANIRYVCMFGDTLTLEFYTDRQGNVIRGNVTDNWDFIGDLVVTENMSLIEAAHQLEGIAGRAASRYDDLF